MRPATTEVLVVVDQVAPGAALTHLPEGELLADVVGERATHEAGVLRGRLAADSMTSAVDQLVAALRDSTSAPLALVDGALVAGPTLLGDVVAEPDGLGRILRDDRGQVLALRVAAGAREDLAQALERAASGWPPRRLLDAVADVAVDLGGAGRELTPGSFLATLAQTPDEAVGADERVGAVDEAALRLRRASRSDDGFLSTFLVRPLSRPLTRRAVGAGLAPAQVTAVALLLGLLSALAYAGGSRVWLVVGSVLLLTSLVVDCVDGELARYTRTTSARGAWLDVAADRIKEYAVYGALAAGVVGAGHEQWLLALASLGLLVTRHFVDFGFAARQVGGSAATTAAEGAVGSWSARTDARPAVRYAKRAVIAPVGERTILLAVLAPTVGVRWTFVVLLALGVVAAGWTTAGRLGRALASRVRPSESARAQLAVQVDGRPLPLHGWRVGGPLGWLIPAGSRALEQFGALLLVDWLAPAALPGLFGWLAVVAIAEYDVTYRGRLTGATAATGPLTVLGWPLRLAAVLVVAALAPDVAGWVFGIGAVLLGGSVLASSRAYWSRWVPSTP
ncbi:CDP-alcohol phosphatidyltransferase family protein [Angustibacter luteus]|uniref:CDP-alcohol phosphatidyltransferase family protein n=1 Tax=Angustibacter luteus TaxID=658456 RepID=A0ABW1JGP1_9ACTN